MAYMGQLKEYVILILSNLLNANVDIGMKYSLSLGYADDDMTKTAFMQVFRNVLNTGTEFEGLGEENQVLQGRYEKLLEVKFLDIHMLICSNVFHPAIV